MEIITSRKNPYIKELAALKKNKSSDMVLIEGHKLIFEARESGIAPKVILVSDSYKGDISNLCANDTRVIQVNDEIIDLLSSTNTPQGIIALIKRREKIDIAEVVIKRGVYLVLDRVADPGNVGTIIRTSEALGASGVVLTPGCADIYNEKTLRATMGSAFRQNIYYSKSAFDAVDMLRGCGAKAYAAALGEKNVLLGREVLPDFCAFVIGNEASGVSQEAISACDSAIMIPMTGKTESLNAAVAASVILWETFRAR